MKLRYRLSLLVGAIFLLCFGGLVLADIELTNKYFQNSSDRIRTHLLSLRDMNRTYLQASLAKELGKRQARINALLLSLTYQSKPLYSNSWAKMINIYEDNKWIDFLQSTKNNQTTAIIPFNAMKMAHEEPINESLSWVVVEGDQTYLGVTLSKEEANPNLEPSKKVDSKLSENGKGRLQILFLPKSLQEAKPTGISSIDRAIAFSKNSSPAPVINGFTQPMTCEFRGVNSHSVGVFLKEQETSAMLTHVLPFLFSTDVHSSVVPSGIASFNNLSSQALLMPTVFYSKAIFQDTAYLQQHPSAKECQGVGSGVAFIDVPDRGHFFFGNTVQLPDNELLTIGINFESVVKEYLLGAHEAAFVAYNGKIIAGYTASGEKPAPLPLDNSMFRNPNGLVSWSGETYYYLHMQPFKLLNLHFYTLDLERRAFSLVNFLEASAKTSLGKLAWDIRMIGLIGLALVLIVLYILSKRITKPITQLAEATDSVAAGKLENISLPITSKKRRDEVSILCNSFAKMVEGLKEKEEVKGVLNKIVSKEIAEEILKGNVRLGGEERRVTVLFADIRRFTEITTQLHPQEIIKLLNTCMTKMSEVIDEQGGVIDKYLGDEVMALFGVPIDHGDSALRAITSGLKIVEVLQEWNREREKQGLVKVEVGIGIHSGVGLVGNMGAENRLNYTVIGKNVNLAARLCSQAGRLQILISRETFEEPQVQEHVAVKELPEVQLKGFEKKVSIFEVVGLLFDSPQSEKNRE